MFEKLLKNKLALSLAVVIILILAGGWYFMNGQSKPVGYNFVQVKRGDLSAEVKADGLVKPATELNLAFERGGQVNQASLKVGDKVKAGQVLAAVDGSDVQADSASASASVAIAQAQLKQLQAALDIQQAKLTDLKNGARPEDLQVSATQKSNAAQSYLDAQTNLDNIKNKASIDLANQLNNLTTLLPNVYNAADDAVNRQTDLLFNNPNSASAELSFDTPLNTAIKAQAGVARVAANQAVAVLSQLSNQLAPDNSNHSQLTAEAINQLKIIRAYLNTTNTALNSVVVSADLPQAKLDGYKANIANGLANINSNITSLTNYEQAITSLVAANQNSIQQAQTNLNNAQNQLSVADKQLVLKQAGSTQAQLDAQTAAVNQAKANLQSQQAQIAAAQATASKAYAQLDKTLIKSPIDGVITDYQVKVGQAAAAGLPLISVISDAKLQLEMYVPEANISLVKLGQQAEVKLDTFGDQLFLAKVISIDPAATVDKNGVPTYKVELEFEQLNDQIKSGLTANVRIIAQTESNELIIPESSVITVGQDHYVIVDNGSLSGERRKIELGQISSNGQVGVTNGLAETDRVADFINNLK